MKKDALGIVRDMTNVDIEKEIKEKIMNEKTSEENLINSLKTYGNLYLKYRDGDKMDKVAAGCFEKLYKMHFEKGIKEGYNISKYPDTLEELTK